MTKNFWILFRKSLGTTQREQKGHEFKEKDYDEIDKYCKSLNIKWFASAWDVNSLEFLQKYNLEYQKLLQL